MLTHAHQIRSSRSGRQFDPGPNRTRTGQIDHDVFEGLPVRRWSRQPHTFSQAPKPDGSEIGVQGPGGTTTLPELPMPRDSELLPPISRALLRAARAGCIHIRQSGRLADDEKEGMDSADVMTTVHMADRSFTTRKWITLPKHMEAPDPEFLARRRPGLPSLYGGAAAAEGSSGAPAVPMRRTKFKKTDPVTGNISIYEAWVPEGHRIEGEITDDVQTIAQQSEVPLKPEAPAPGTVVEGVGVVNAEGVVVAEAGSAAVVIPSKRRPPPPKRKGKGIGRGRRKKVMFAPGDGADAALVHGDASGAAIGLDGVRDEGADASQMSVDQSGQDDDEDEGEEGEQSDEGDESVMDAKTPETPQPSTEAVAKQPAATADVEMADVHPEIQPPVPEPSSPVEKVPQQQIESGTSQPLEETPQAETIASDSVLSELSAEKTEEATDLDDADHPDLPAVAASAETGSLEQPPVTTQPDTTLETAGTAVIETTEPVVSRDEAQGPPPTTLTAADEAPVSTTEEVAGLASKEDKEEPRITGLDESAPAAPSASAEKPDEEAATESHKQLQTPEQSSGEAAQSAEVDQVHTEAEAPEQATEQHATQPDALQQEDQAPENNAENEKTDLLDSLESSLGTTTAPTENQANQDSETGNAPTASEQQTASADDSAATQPPAESATEHAKLQSSSNETGESSAPESGAVDEVESGLEDGEKPTEDTHGEETVAETGEPESTTAVDITEDVKPEQKTDTSEV